MSSVAARPYLKGPAEQLMSGELFTGLLLDDTEQRAMALESLLGKVVDDDTRLVWVGNPLRSPLTIERFLIQIAGPEIDLREERSPKELAQLISTQIGNESRLLIVVQQPETINAETIHLLVQMGWYLSGEAVQVQFLFAGSSAFIVPRLAEPQVMALSSTFEAADTADMDVLQTVLNRREVLPLILLLLTATAGGVFSMTAASQDGIAVDATPPGAGSAQSSPASRQASKSTRAAGASDRNPAVACP